LKGKAVMAALTIPALGAALALTVANSNRQVAVPLRADLALPENLRPVIGRACRDCHTDQTQWPWYSWVPPVSFLIQHDVKKGRAKLDFSTWTNSQPQRPTGNQIEEVCDAVSNGTMPPRSYRLMHPEARLSAQDIAAFCSWADTASNLTPVGPNGTPR
jgi:hypothetical protein